MKDKLAKVGELYRNVDDGELTLGYKRDTFVRETIIKADKKGEIQEDGFIFKVKIPAQSSWSVSFDVRPRAAGRYRGHRDVGPEGRTQGHGAGRGPRGAGALATHFLEAPGQLRVLESALPARRLDVLDIGPAPAGAHVEADRPGRLRPGS